MVGVHHPKWEERPIMIVERHDDSDTGEAAIKAFLETRVARWWMPDRILFEAVPLTATGKIDKKVIRARHLHILDER